MCVGGGGEVGPRMCVCWGEGEGKAKDVCVGGGGKAKDVCVCGGGGGR